MLLTGRKNFLLRKRITSGFLGPKYCQITWTPISSANTNLHWLYNNNICCYKYALSYGSTIVSAISTCIYHVVLLNQHPNSFIHIWLLWSNNIDHTVREKTLTGDEQVSAEVIHKVSAGAHCWSFTEGGNRQHSKLLNFPVQTNVIFLSVLSILPSFFVMLNFAHLRSSLAKTEWYIL
jgi:hypothetical protein